MVKTVFFMKVTKLILFVLLSIYSMAQNLIYWEPEMIVSNGAVYGNTRPRMSLNANNEPVIVYGKISDGKLYCSRMDNGVFVSPVPLTGTSISSYLATWTGPDIAAKGDTVIVVFKAEPMETGHIYTTRSIDGGISFNDPVQVDQNDTTASWLPSMDMDENGNPSVIFMSHSNNWTHPRYMIAHSQDHGSSYLPTLDVALSVPEEACDCCPAEYVISEEKHALLYRNNENNIRDIYAVYSNDDGSSYPTALNVDNLDWEVNSCPSTGPHGIFLNNQLLTVYSSRGTGNSRVFLTFSNAGTDLGFVQRIIMAPPANSSGMQNYPRISGKGDTIVMVWQESDPSNPEIMCAFTTNFQQSEILSTKHILNSTTSGSQTNPDVIYRNGEVHVVYTDGNSGNVIYRKGRFSALNSPTIADQQMTIYPNPSSTGNFTFQSDEQIRSCKVYDLSGKEVTSVLKNTGVQYELLIPSDNKGIFILELNFNEGNSSFSKLKIH
jgi:hypothetical protein